MVESDFHPVVHQSDHAEAHKDEEHEQNVKIGDIGPQQGGNHRAEHNQQSAHGRRARLVHVGKHIFMNVLAELELVQYGDEARPYRDGQDQGKGHGDGCPERNVAEHIERTEIRAERDKQIIEHGLPQRP